jgi:predicted nuclease of predicted toxin-antitoxin system
MKFLVDNALSPRLAEQLRACGHDATHVVDYGMGSAHDPSVIIFRGLTNRRPDAQSATLVANLPVLAADLEAGSIVIVDEDRLRVRRLPIVEIR